MKPETVAATPGPDGTASQENIGIAASQASQLEGSIVAEGLDFEDNIAFSEYIIKPSNLKQIWSTFKVKKAMLDYLQWYFRPRNSYDPERVDYNALNILAEYQTYNLEFVKNELDLSDEQSCVVLEMLWNLLEFDPDEKSVQVE